MFAFEVKPEGAVYLELRGEIDIELAHQIKPELDYHLTSAKSFTIDAAGVSYIDSSGISVLVRIMQMSKDANISLTIARASAQLIRVLSLARLLGLFTIHEYCPPAPTEDDSTIITALKGGTL